MHDYIKTS